MEEQERPCFELRGAGITRRAALGGLLSAVLLPTAMAGEAAAVPAPKPNASTGYEDPDSSAAGVSPLARALHTATLLPDGRILVVGGISTNNRALASVQIYDPRRDVWTDATPLQLARYQHAAVAIGNRVLVTGGLSRPGHPVAGAEVYDPGADAWSAAPPMALERYGHALELLPDGRVIVIGGIHATPVSNSEYYDPNTAA